MLRGTTFGLPTLLQASIIMSIDVQSFFERRYRLGFAQRLASAWPRTAVSVKAGITLRELRVNVQISSDGTIRTYDHKKAYVTVHIARSFGTRVGPHTHSLISRLLLPSSQKLLEAIQWLGDENSAPFPLR